MTPNTFKMNRTPSFGSANAEARRRRPCLWALLVAVCAGTMLATPGTTFAQSEVAKVLASDAAAGICSALPLLSPAIPPSLGLSWMTMMMSPPG